MAVFGDDEVFGGVFDFFACVFDLGEPLGPVTLAVDVEGLLQLVAHDAPAAAAGGVVGVVFQQLADLVGALLLGL